MAGIACTNDRIPTDPHSALALLLAITLTASQLTPEQLQALPAALALTELTLYVLHRLRGEGT